MNLRIHVICVALNEEVFLPNMLRPLYPFCSGISILTQYDRNWYGEPVEPDKTIEKVLNFPDPEGKIHLVARRFPDQTAARNSEMLTWLQKPSKNILCAATPKEKVDIFHQIPDYFLIVDADEIYDAKTFPAILDRLERKHPKAMRVWGLNYVRTWNQRCSASTVPFCHFGFIKAGILLKSIRKITFNNTRLSKLLDVFRLPDFSDRLFGFDTCPMEVGYFHHGCWLGNNNRLEFKASRAGHREEYGGRKFVDRFVENIDLLKTEFVPTNELPSSIREGSWPVNFFEDTTFQEEAEE